MENQKIYVGNGKKDQFGNINLSICLSDLPDEFIYEYQGKKYISLIAGKKREIDNYKRTHYIKVNTYKPEDKSEPSFNTQESV